MFKIEEITIKNFRSISTMRVETNHINVFVGNNDAGKSNVLKALNLFFNGETDHKTTFNFDNDYCKFAKPPSAKKPREITISLKFSLPSSYNDKYAVWTKVWRKESLGNQPKKDEKKYPQQKQGEKNLRYTKTDTFLRNISYKYIPTIKSEDYFQFLVGELYSSIAAKAEKAFVESSTGFVDTLQSVTSNLSENLKSQLKMESKLIIDFPQLFKSFSFQTSIDDNNTIDLRQRGDGIRTRHIPEILYTIHKNIVESKERGAIASNTIWGYEEPETAIELSMCFDFAHDFIKYSKEIPIFITTHSPAFYSIAGKEKNAKLYSAIFGKDGTVCSVASLDNVHNSLGLMQLIAPAVEEANEKYRVLKEEYKLLASETRNKSPIVFVEGEIDKMYLEKYIGLKHPNLAIEIKAADGKSKMDSLLKLLQTDTSILNRKIIFLYDCDVGHKEDSFDDKLYIRVANHNSSATDYKVGAENLLSLPSDFDYKRYHKQEKSSPLGAPIYKVDKMKLANDICRLDDVLVYLHNWEHLVKKILSIAS